jgi:hypothetical protein
MRSLIAPVIALSLLFVAACSDDDADRTTAAYCEDLKVLDDGDEGGPTDAFFEAHPDPTMEDWAEALPGMIDDIKASRDEFADIEPSADMKRERSAFLDAMDAFIASFEDSLAAAKAGDQAEFDRLEAENQDKNAPAIGAGMEAVASACGVDE